MVNWRLNWSDGEWFTFHAVTQSVWMTVMWSLCMIRNNGSMVDFGWPSGFTFMAVVYWLFGGGPVVPRTVICGLYVVAGSRFMIGWAVGRQHWKYEDKRWNFWRERWAAGESMLFGCRSIGINFFGFYHSQSLCNIAILSVPLHLCCTGAGPAGLSPLQYFAVALWLAAFALENVADVQLSAFKDRERAAKKAGGAAGGVMNTGLWRYSRHPNYCFEWFLWVAYVLLSVERASLWWHYLLLSAVPAVAYYYLVHFTGIWMAERASIAHRGDAYRRYINQTSAFWLWPPATAPAESHTN